jgi:HK97 family phage major capsid protein
MSKSNELIKFNFEDAQKGNFTQIKDVLKDVKAGNLNANNILYAIDAAAQNSNFLEKFIDGFSREFGHKVSFRTLTAEEMKLQEEIRNFAIEQKNFDTTQSTIASTIGTTIIPTVEYLIKTTELLSEINIQHVGGSAFYQMFDFDSEQSAVVLSEVATGSDVDEVLRKGDTLIPNYKAQGSFKLSEFAINNMDGYLLGKYIARLANRVKAVLINSILYSGSAAANGTAKNSLRGIKNNFGVNATGDLAGAIGAVIYATAAAASAAIVTAGGVASTDKYDLAIKAKELLLPPNLQDVEEDSYVYVMNRASWGAVSTIQDLNGRYKAQTMFDPVTGKAIRMLDGARVIIDPRVATSEVFLFPPKFYTLIIKGDIINLNDGGLVQLREGLTSFVSRAWVDGSMEYGQKFRPTTAVTIGTTTPDNNAQNAFLVFSLV